MDETKKHRRSVSQWSSFVKCSEGYRLEKIAKAPARPAAWFAQGIAVHSACEFWEEGFRQAHPDDVVDLYETEFDRLIAEATETEPDLGRWLTGGRVRASDDIGRRRTRGAEQVLGYLRYASEAQERVWLIGGQEPALEVEFELDLDGVTVKGFIDQIIEWPTGQIGPRDVKTGSKRPDWPFQLGVYRLAIEQDYGYLPTWGDFYMAKDNRPDAPVDLSAFTRSRVTRWFHDMDRSVNAGLFLPNPGDHCRTCGVSDFCSAVGSRADEYPPKEETQLD
ncbi:PD-(D/E)XK nuclease family protein [Asanoa sp. WMMD1127]|uniref:PD-(D/E)XK nuclease family protein n=1 Tax=Asanoa sp. WMMD1127 TaxID=3016107 RepID=UPI0024176AD2|nr:PD-(D/E)XK nuclease family protein [Asanoa sp. WMMD1127]MDG4825980.1 PD-(D/E)XK nuclease family protein [Asanoa sp. WMMD1127]